MGMEKFLHKKSLGQNFLNSDYVPKKMSDAANLKKGDVVLEIGPGVGALTKELLKREVAVIAIEADARAITSLQETFSEEIKSGQLTLHHADARKLDLVSYGLKAGEYKVVANIPYYLSGLLLRNLLDTETQPKTLVFLIQKELAERIAREKKESLLSLSVKVFGEPTYICTVKRGHFTPPPKVDSAILAVHNISKDSFKDFSSESFFEILHLGFGQKRKQLAHNLGKAYGKEKVVSGLTGLNLPPTTRAEDMSVEEWLTFAEFLLK